MKARFLALAALLFGLAACQTEPEGFDVNLGGEQEVMLTVSLPEATRADSAQGFDLSSLATPGSNYSLRYILEIYRVDEGGVDYKNCQRFVETSDLTTMAFPVKLVPGRNYRIVAWADIVEGDSKADRCYTTTNGLDEVAIIDSMWNPMDETRDAYTGTQLVENFNSSTNIPNMTLTRPFAKLRVVSTDIKEVRDLGIKPTRAVVEYNTQDRDMYCKYNALTKTAFGAQTKRHEFTYVAGTYEADNASTLTLFTDYIFAADEQEVVNFSLEVFDQKNESIKYNNFNTAIPVKRNTLTTIKGDVLTLGENIVVNVEKDFVNKDNLEDEPYYVEYKEAGSAQELVEILNEVENATGETHIVLTGKINLDDLFSASTLSTRSNETASLVIPAGKSVILDLNGYTISQTKECTDSYSMIANNGNLTITGEGTIEFTNTAEGGSSTWGTYTIENRGEGVLTIDNATIRHNGCVNGDVNRDTNIAIQNYQGKVVINGGTIASTQFRSLRDFTAGGEIIINGGTFLGQVWIQGLGNGPSSLTINGGNFSPVAGYDGSSVYITNSGNIVNVAVNGGMFNTKIGCYDATKEGAKGCITGGTFTTTAMENTNAALLANGYVFAESENGNYTVENTGHYTDAEGNEHITTAAGLLWFAGEVNKYSNYERPFENVTIYLENDIDLDGIEWTPIGDYRFSANRFCGTFDGQNHTISNFKITKKTDKNDSNKSSYGFFGNLEGTIKNVKVSKVNVSSYAYTAALVGRFNNGLIENCHVVDCAVSNTYWQGGILIGQTNAEGEVVAIVRNCSVSNSSITSKSAIGAISGPVTANKGGNVVFENCSVANCAVNQDGSFGGSYDKYFGSMFGYTEADADSSIEIKNFTVSNTTVKGESNAPISGDFDGNITIDGCKMVTVDTEEGLVNAVKAQSIITLANDITMSKSVAISNANFTLDGNGKTITMAEDATNNIALFDITGGKATFKNVTFDGIKSGAIVRTVGVEFNAENVTAQNGQHTQQQGLFRLFGESTITNSTFKNNICQMVVSFCFDHDTDSMGTCLYALSINGCEFAENTCSTTAVCYYANGSAATLNGNKFVNNTLTVSNGATVYLGFKKNCSVTNNLFDGNTVTATSKRSAGGLMVGNAAVVTGNAFVNNTVTVNGETGYGNDVCASPYYAAIDLSGNYWGGGAPVENDDYYKEYNNYEVIINDYLTENPIK